MASASKTPNLNLPQWVGTEKPERTDFNAAFDAIDTTVASHMADYATLENSVVKNNETRKLVISGHGQSGWTGLGRSNIISNTVFYFKPQLPSGSKIKKVTVKFASDRSVNYRVRLQKEGSLFASGYEQTLENWTSTTPNWILEQEINYTVEDYYGVVIRVDVESSGGSYTYVYPAQIDIELGGTFGY